MIEDAEVSLKVSDAGEMVSDHSLLSNRHLQTDSSSFPAFRGESNFLCTTTCDILIFAL